MRDRSGANIELTELGGGDFAGKITRVDFHRLWMQRLSENLPRILHSAHSVTCHRIVPDTARGEPDPQRYRGQPEQRCLSRHQPQLLSAIFRPDRLGCDVDADGGHALRHGGSHRTRPEATATRPDRQSWRPADGASAAPASGGRQAAEVSPDIIANPAAAHGLEQALLQAMIACLGMPDRVVRDTAAIGMRRSCDASTQPSVSAPARRSTFPSCDHAHRRCSGADFAAVLLRKPGHGTEAVSPPPPDELARQRLRRADSTVTTVTEIAASLGFWSFALFAVEYKALFDEAPSGTLQQAAP